MDYIHSISMLIYDIVEHLEDVTHLQHYLFQQSHNSSQQIESMQQASKQVNMSQRSTPKKSETRMCFRCNEVGHIAKKIVEADYCNSNNVQTPDNIHHYGNTFNVNGISVIHHQGIIPTGIGNN